MKHVVLPDLGDRVAGPRFPVQVGLGPAGHQAPVVDAGVDQTIYLPDSVVLDATVTDDGHPVPPGVVTTLWTQVSGPGSVTFADASAVDTTADFSGAGTYVLRITADDGELVITDDMTVEAVVNQALLELERCAAGKAKTALVPHMGGGVHDPADICKAIEEAAK